MEVRSLDMGLIPFLVEPTVHRIMIGEVEVTLWECGPSRKP